MPIFGSHMLLRWALIYGLFVMVVVLGCLLYFQHVRAAAGIADVVSLNAKLDEQHKLLTNAERKLDQAGREARAATDKLAEERGAREEAERAYARAQNEIAELKKAKGAADEATRQALAQLERERQTRKRQTTIASRRSIARAMRAARAESERLTRATVPAADILPPPKEQASPLPPAPSSSSPAPTKPNATSSTVEPAPAPASTSSIPLPKKKGTPAPKAAKKPSSVWDGLLPF